MKKTLLISFAAIALFATGCKKNTTEVITPVTPVVPVVPKNYALTEDFEAA